MTPQERFVVGARARRIAWSFVIGGALAAIAGLAADPHRTWPDLLLNGYYMLALALAGMVFIALEHLCGASWSADIRRVPEAMMSALPTAALLMLVLFFGREWLYGADRLTGHTASPSKAMYLSTPFFFGRMVLFVVVWTAFATAMRRASLRQDVSSAPIHHRRLVRFSAAFIVVFAISFSLASFDWLMTLTRDWSSTIFAIYAFAGLFVGGLAAITLAVVLLLEGGYLTDVVTGDHLHDLGKLLFAFSIFWAYIWFSQYLLIWYGNLPDETQYYLARTGNRWTALFLLNLVVNWVVPLLVLMTREAKRNPIVLKWTAIVILAGRWLDLYLAVMPGMTPSPAIHVLDLLIAGGYAAAFFLLMTRALAGARLVVAKT
jgi:hypothetical protein